MQQLSNMLIAEKLDKKKEILKINKGLSNEEIKKAILNEKRKRVQAYSALDYLISMTTYFSFFTKEAFDICLYGFFLRKEFKFTELTLELFFISLLERAFELKDILKEYGLHTELFITKKNTNKIFHTLLLPFKKACRFLNVFQDQEEINFIFPSDILEFFDKVMDNAVTRFKTPVITPEIFFITFMEDKNSKIGALIAEQLQNERDFFMLRYRILKRLHKEELFIKKNVQKNQRYFAYLLKTQLSSTEFNALFERNLQEVGILLFRNKLITEALKIDLLDAILKDTYRSISYQNTRQYTT